MYIINEKVYGNMATVFHRTSISDLVNKVFDSGFKPGDGDMYGKGFYSTYRFSSQGSDKMIKTYGPIVVKFTVPISTFFIFDYAEFIKSPNFKKVGSPSKDTFLIAQFKFFKMDYSKFDQSEADFNYRTSSTALWCCKNIPNFKKLCEGIIFTGEHDGQVLVSYNTKLVYPLSYTSDEGRTWTTVEKNLDYLKKVSKIKNRFIPDLSRTPEDFGITDYEFDAEGFLNVNDYVNLSEKNLTEIPFKFGKVVGSFDCSDNKLTSLKGAPTVIVDGDFSCSNNKLTTLQGAPKKVGSDFLCQHNELISLEGSPEVVNNFVVYNNNLKTLKGAPKIVKGSFDCSNNAIVFTEEDVKKVSNVKKHIYLG